MKKIMVVDKNYNEFVYYKSDFDADFFIEQLMLKGETGEPEEIQVDTVDMTVEQIKAWYYLASTDWYGNRKVDTGEAIPQTVLDARAVARSIL